MAPLRRARQRPHRHLQPRGVCRSTRRSGARSWRNGLTYYVRKNARPAKRAVLWLVVDAGSVLEDDDQRGLAHFLEHMAFNGTRRYAKQEIVNYLQGLGMRFGPDINAFTSFDETVYQLEVPTDDAALDRAVDILHEWAQGITIDPAEVDKERGVVLEERRLGRGAQGRLLDKLVPAALPRSKYGDRLPIGTEDVLKHASADTLRRFYRAWYRPELMAVVAVGDFDAAAMEKRIAGRFGDLPAAARRRRAARAGRAAPPAHRDLDPHRPGAAGHRGRRGGQAAAPQAGQRARLPPGAGRPPVHRHDQPAPRRGAARAGRPLPRRRRRPRERGARRSTPGSSSPWSRGTRSAPAWRR